MQILAGKKLNSIILIQRVCYKTFCYPKINLSKPRQNVISFTTEEVPVNKIKVNSLQAQCNNICFKHKHIKNLKHFSDMMKYFF